MTEEKEAIILCGGQSWMLKPEAHIPKPLLSLGNQTIIERQVNWLAQHGLKKIVLAVSKDLLGYIMLKTDVYKKFREVKSPEVKLSIEDYRLGTGGALKRACRYLNGEVFYACNVDDLAFEFNPNNLLSELNGSAVMLLAQPTLPYGRVKVQNGSIKEFVEKPKLDFFVNAGHYALKKKDVLDTFPERGDLERAVLPKLATRGRLKGKEYHGAWITIDTFEDYLNALSVFSV